MKILIICQWFPPEYAPLGVMLKELACDLAKYGHEVTVITGFPNYPDGIVFPGYRKSLMAAERADGFSVVRCYLYTSPRRTFIRRVANHLSFAFTSFVAAIRADKPDVLFMVSPPLSSGAIALMLSKLRGIRYVFNIQDIFPEAAINTGTIKNRLLIRLLEWVERKTYRDASRVTVISEGFKRNLLGKGVPAAKVEVIPNWLDTSELRPCPRDNAFAREHGLAGKFVVLYSGTIGLISGAEILLQCAARLSPYEDIVVLLVGEGVVKEQLAKKAAERRLANVRFLPLQDRSVVPQMQSSSDVSVVTLLPGKGKTSVPSKILGYMSVGRPVVASVDLDSDTARMIEEAGCGICVSPGDAAALTEAILVLYRDRTLAAKMGGNGRAYLVAHLQRQHVTARYEKVFKDLC